MYGILIFIVWYICFLFIKSRQLVDEKLIKIKIQFIQNEIHFKESLSTKQTYEVVIIMTDHVILRLL